MSISVVIPTYKREKVLVETLEHVAALYPQPAEIIVIDQTKQHEKKTEDELSRLVANGVITHVRLDIPSITHSMNLGLLKAKSEIVLFLDDDVIPTSDLISAHLVVHRERKSNIVAGRVLQPWDDEGKYALAGAFSFASLKSQYIEEFMGGNFSIKKKYAIELGGFDENFVHVAYRFEKEFSDRVLASGERIYFEPRASIRHLRSTDGGVRSFGEHLKTIKPSHSVGAYYYLLQSKRVKYRILEILKRTLRALKTRHHFSHPWWIFPTLVAEMQGLFWALFLFYRGPRQIGWEGKRK